MSPKQRYSSAKTCVNQVPAAMKKIDWDAYKGSVNLDYGGGKYETASNYLFGNFGVVNMVYDPFNRTESDNAFVHRFLSRYKADTATCFNVLNVIKEKAVRKQVLNNIKFLMKPWRLLYISVYRGNGDTPKETCNGWQNNKPLEWYLKEIKSVFPGAWIRHGMIFARS